MIFSLRRNINNGEIKGWRFSNPHSMACPGSREILPMTHTPHQSLHMDIKMNITVSNRTASHLHVYIHAHIPKTVWLHPTNDYLWANQSQTFHLSGHLVSNKFLTLYGPGQTILDRNFLCVQFTYLAKMDMWDKSSFTIWKKQQLWQLPQLTIEKNYISYLYNTKKFTIHVRNHAFPCYLNL